MTKCAFTHVFLKSKRFFKSSFFLLLVAITLAFLFFVYFNGTKSKNGKSILGEFSFLNKLVIKEGSKVGGGGQNAGEENLKLSAFEQISKPIYAAPVKIIFGGKSLDIEEVGVLEDGALDVPKDWNKAGWYAQGAKPGEDGNVIIDGHFDTNTGKPAAFWGLKDLQLNDKVLIVDSLGRIFVYKVEEKFYIGINDPNRSQVFNSSQDKILTLITCGGVWDNLSKTYNKRLVVKARFENMEKPW